MKYSELLDFVNKKFSVRNIAKETHKSPTTIRYWLKTFNLTTCHKSFKDGYKHTAVQTIPATNLCRHCGETNPSAFYGSKKRVCGACHNADCKQRWKAKKHRIVEYLGGKCVYCGFDKYDCSLQVHHLDPSKKDPGFGHHKYWAWSRVITEIQHCVLLCANCHSAHHAGLIQLPPK